MYAKKCRITCEAIKTAADLDVPALGICQEFQAICEIFGGFIKEAPEIIHGKTSMIYHNEKNIFFGIPSPFKAMRYHSLIMDDSKVPNILEITAKTEDNIIMGGVHKSKKYIEYSFILNLYFPNIGTNCCKIF